MSSDIDIYVLTYLLKQRPILWNTQDKEHRSKKKIGSAWEDVCGGLQLDFSSWSDEERKKYCEAVKMKWKNVKTYYEKLKKNSDDKKLKNYKHRELLSFLDSISDTEEQTRRDDSGRASARSSGRLSGMALDLSNINDEMERMMINTGSVDDLQFIVSMQSEFDDFDDDCKNELKDEIMKAIRNIKCKETASKTCLKSE